MSHTVKRIETRSVSAPAGSSERMLGLLRAYIDSDYEGPVEAFTGISSEGVPGVGIGFDGTIYAVTSLEARMLADYITDVGIGDIYKDNEKAKSKLELLVEALRVGATLSEQEITRMGGLGTETLQ